MCNRRGEGGAVLLCEHASHYVPDAYQGLGLDPEQQVRHIGWDLGALGLARELAAQLDAPLVYATYSRLLLDVNRPVDAADSIVTQSEGTLIPGNQDLSSQERQLRRSRIYEPFHAAIEELIDERLAAGLGTVVLSIHSFTPAYHGVKRPWHGGVISDSDRRLADALLEHLSADPSLLIGDNLPYGPHDGVYHSMQRHALARGLPGAMVEVRNDQLDAAGQGRWTRLLHQAVAHALATLALRS